MLTLKDNDKLYLKIFLQRYKEIRHILIDTIYEGAKTTRDHSRLRGQQDIIDLFDDLTKE